MPRAVLLCALSLAPSLFAAEAKPARFNRDILPILSGNCYFCHGPDAHERKGDLRLDVRDDAVKSGAIVPGKPGESELVKRLHAHDPDDVMPPPESKKTLTAAEKALLERWIREGAEYEAHWAYTPLRRPEVPALRGVPVFRAAAAGSLKAALDAGATEKSGAAFAVRNPVDAFIAARLVEEGAGPSREADRRSLLRRLSLDLTGLPPAPEEVAAFVADASPDAYEKQVDRLLASPHHGERLAVWWLDAARFSDTVGYHGDQNQRIFPYRDYVIDAFNANLPFDRFILEQLAGDLLPNATPAQRTASGFNRLNMVTREGGAQPGEYLAKYAADRVRTVSGAFLGSTMGCAECHDHKFDPFTMRDFYTMAAFFADLRQWGVYADYGYTPNPDLRGFNNDFPFPPELEVDSPHLQRRQARLEGEMDALADAALAAAKPEDFAPWRDRLRAFLEAHPDGWITPDPGLTAAAKDAATNAVAEAGGVVLLTKDPGKEGLRIELDPGAGTVAALRLELLPHERHGGALTRKPDAGATVRLSVAVRRAGQKKDQPVGVYFADSAFKEPRYSHGMDLTGVHDGWKISAARRREAQTAVWLLDRPAELAAGDRLVVTLHPDQAGCARLSVSPLANGRPLRGPDAAALGRALAVDRNLRAPADQRAVAHAWFHGPGGASAWNDYKALHAEWAQCRGGRAHTLVSEAWEPRVTRVLPRGNWQDESGAVVLPAPPRFLAEKPETTEGRATRADLARWITAPGNPLTSRALMNRLWKAFFGNGLSLVVDDLGAQGEAPSHPELLDWLAVEFRESGWDLRHMIRTLVLSSTYRQDAGLRPDRRDADPLNRLLASQNPRRLEAEFVRDNALAAAGILHRDLGGPSVKPYQPPGYYAQLQFPDRDYAAHRDERQWRRGLYMHWQRTFLHPMLANFDAPAREESACTRNVSNTPQQALTLLNDPTFVEAARALAARALAEPGADDRSRLERVFQWALARPPKPREADSLRAFLAGQRDHYRANPADAQALRGVGLKPNPPDLDPVEHAAWTQACRVVLNLHETITRY